jgi:hypothetical protein
MALNRVLYFNDLWNTLAYTRAATVWTPQTKGTPFRPRRASADNDPGASPFALRNLAGTDGRVAAYRQLLACCVQNVGGAWVEKEASTLTALDPLVRDCFPEALRRHTLMAVIWPSPHLLDRLSADERAGYAAMSRFTAAWLERMNFAAVEVGPQLTAQDYADFVHLAEPGGERMAELLAPRLRALARELGYTEPDSEP